MPSTSKRSRQNKDFSLISREKLLTLYAGLLRCRMLEDFVAQNVPARRSASRTRSAAAVAACAGHAPGDEFAAPPRDFLPAFVKGEDLAAIFSALHTPADAQRTQFSKQLHAALAAARKHHENGNRNIMVIFGRPSTGRQWQAMLRAATNELLPIIFVCKGQSHQRSLRPPRYLPAITVDRDDVVALYRVVSEGIAHARRGNGPTLIECVPWHTAGKLVRSDAITNMEAYLAQKGISPVRRKARVKAQFESELAYRKRSL